MNYFPDKATRFLVQRLQEINSRCPICSSPSLFDNHIDPTNPPNSRFTIFCSRCGEFSSNRAFSERKNDLTHRQIANASGYIRNNQGFSLKTSKDIEFLKHLSTLSVAGKAQSLIRNLAKIFPIAGTTIDISFTGLDECVNYYRDHKTFSSPIFEKTQEAVKLLPLLGFSFAENEDELLFLLDNYLKNGVNYIEGNTLIPTTGIKRFRIAISPLGWEFLERSPLVDSDTGFVAMWFDPSMNCVRDEVFYPAIQEAGYKALRIDRHEHNNKIDDEIIASIRECKFIIADFTGDRGGVYYEAGFAAGLNKPVIWTVREDFLKELHFDTRQFNHIPWKQDDLPAFKKALRNRIEATLGRGPIRVEASSLKGAVL